MKLIYLFLALSALLTTFLSAARPNIVFLLADDQRYDTMGVTGNEIFETPQLDRLANEGVLFDQSFVVSSACAPNRAAIFSGMYSRSSGVRDFSADFTPAQRERLYPFLLQDAGYYIGFIGKWGVAATIESTMEPYKKRFDYWRGLLGQGHYYTADRKDRHLTQVMADQAEEFFQTAPKDRPFCLSVSFKAPHGPWNQYDRRFRDNLANVEIPYPQTLTEEAISKLPPFMRTFRLSLNGKSVAKLREVHQEFVRQYYRLIIGLDEAVGRIRTSLEAQGLAENTIIVYASDNGHFIHEWGFHGKWLMYEPSIHVPLIVYDPRLPEDKRGKRISALTQSIDYAPTFLELADVSVPETMQGRSLMPLVRGETPDDWRDDVFHDYSFEMYPGDIPKSIGVRTDRYKLVRYTAPRPQYEQLFDLRKDPLELNNLIDNPDYFEIRLDLRQRLSNYRRELKDRLPDYEEYVNTYDVVGIGKDFPDLEMDFHEVGSIGQTFLAAGEHLMAAEWRWPFFMQQRSTSDFQVSLFRGGPEGERLKSVILPAEDIYNLSLAHARLEVSGLKTGETLFLEIRPLRSPSALKMSGLFLYSGNPFPSGQVLLDGLPLARATAGLRLSASNTNFLPTPKTSGDLPIYFIYRR